MLNLQSISYIHSDKEFLLRNLNLTVANHDKIALIGNNGAGKSTLLKIIAKELQPSGGQIILDTEPYFVPQMFGQFNHLTIAEALGIDKKLDALNEILSGITSERNFNLLNDDWTIEDTLHESPELLAFEWIELDAKNGNIKRWRKNKGFSCGHFHSSTRIDIAGRTKQSSGHKGRGLLYDFIKSTKSTLIVVSHDRKLLNLFGHSLRNK